MSDSSKLKNKPLQYVDSIVELIKRGCDIEQIPEEHIIYLVLERLGYRIPELERQVKLELTEDTIEKLNQKIKEISKRIAKAEVPKTNRRYKGPNIMDRSRAQYIVEYTLMSIDCRKDGKRVKKKDVDSIMGFSNRTMRAQQSLYKEIILTPNTLENQLYIELQNYLAEI